MKLNEIIACIAYLILFALMILGISKLAILGDSYQQQRLESQANMEACNDIIIEER